MKDPCVPVDFNQVNLNSPHRANAEPGFADTLFETLKVRCPLKYQPDQAPEHEFRPRRGPRPLGFARHETGRDGRFHAPRRPVPGRSREQHG